MAVELVDAQTGRYARRQQLPEEVASYVRELIMSGDARPGEFLRMERIAEAMGVSNTPVREGLLLLRSEGFVSQVPRRGFVVATFTRQDIRDLFWTQAVLAGELAARAATKMTPEGLHRLEETVEQYQRAMKENSDDIDYLGYTFHREINIAADSRRLALLLGALVKSVPKHFYSTIEGQVAATIDEHPLLIDALRKKQGRKARSIMEKHIEGGADRLIGMLEQRGLWTDETES
jgi:DNA-binding GntR family transcriptional regulator